MIAASSLAASSRVTSPGERRADEPRLRQALVPVGSPRQRAPRPGHFHAGPIRRRARSPFRPLTASPAWSKAPAGYPTFFGRDCDRRAEGRAPARPSRGVFLLLTDASIDGPDGISGPHVSVMVRRPAAALRHGDIAVHRRGKAENADRRIRVGNNLCPRQVRSGR